LPAARQQQVSVLHLAIAFGGPDWYAFFGAPQGLVDMARAGNVRAPLSCLVIAAFLALLAAYAFSGAGRIRRLPLLRLGLATIAAVLILRGVLFVPLILWRPDSLSRICDCRSVDAFILATSALLPRHGCGLCVGGTGTAPQFVAALSGTHDPTGPPRAPRRATRRTRAAIAAAASAHGQ
jgi:hypothetical protein